MTYPLSNSSFAADDGPRIKVVGTGGGGSNAVNRMFREPIPGVEYITVNTDAQALLRCETPTRFQIGERITRGLGVGGDPEIGRQAAEESHDELADLLRNGDMIFLAAGMGGGTGTGSAPVVAELSRDAGALTVAVVTKPFGWEGQKRRKVAEAGIHRLKDKVDALIVIPNDRLNLMADYKLTMNSAFRLADEVLRQAVQAIAELVTVPGEINLDFADIRAVMRSSGPAWLGIGLGSGEHRALDAARNAINCPLLEVAIDGAKGVIFNITGGENLSLAEVQAAAELIGESIDPEASLFFGMVHDPKMEDEVRITIVATGFPSNELLTSTRDADLFNLVQTEATENRSGEIDLPPFLRRSFNLRRPVRSNGRV